ncbi:RNA polymerase sigma factor [Mucilaginibacter sp. SJ]|uniref:RNA polymerase sigma factor n=1 Tax=Mucilaginibacter sp. SJ TaxID=3029053 RepID=UPI0023A99B9C|nr:RNA polymerase sigma-70 factor [Mucilaginibacter sp. SJ]WEA00584.1 RNA polymerase sigma-70 factor [Mucilaginibacter sp. SJ]
MVGNLYTSDTVLLSLISEGDEKAFALLFERYRNRLYSYLVKVTKSKETSEEIVLDVFLKVWTGKAALPEINNFEAFLFRVAQNRTIDFFRQAKRYQKEQAQIWKGMEELRSATADSRLLKADLEKTIQAAVSQLSPQRQEVFRLSREEYLSYDEIAERMELSKFTVRNHLSAALQFIRSHLDNGPELAIFLMMFSKSYCRF